MKKLILLFSLAVVGGMSSCVDKNEEVDADSKPSWLHGSIYQELMSPSGGSDGLEGTFNNYLRLIDDLGYAEVLNRTGSKTVFPANDSAFARFFASNDWGVTSYEQLSDAQKKLLLYNSMLDNALLTTMFSNVSASGSSTSSVDNGRAVKHQTNISVTDTIQHIYGPSDMPRGNKHWERFYDTGIDIVSDNTRPMMVHFTREQMVNNNITVSGENSDFEVLTGSPYEEEDGTGTVFIFDDKVIHRNITCMNGYIHQVQDVLVPPGNMAQVIRKNSETSLFSRILDYFAVPYLDEQTTNDYNDWAQQNNMPTKDAIYQVRYLSSWSQGASLTEDADNKVQSSYLSYDPGWNQYYPKPSYSTYEPLADIGAMFVPDDDAFVDYFTEGGKGAFIVDIYGKYKDEQNTEANLRENFDSIFSKNPDVFKSFIRNLQMRSFVSSVPSKFTTLINDAAENLGMNMEYLKKSGDRYDIKIANNGVVYVLNKMLPPDEFQAVLAPSSVYPDMKVMNWAVQDRSYLGVDFKYYLLAMKANYAFFVPDDEAFDCYYVDPASLGKAKPEAIHFYYDSEKQIVRADNYYYDLNTNTVGERISEVGDITNYKSQLVDILNYHTLVLNDGEVIGDNKFYKTKHGGEVFIDGGNKVGATVSSGAQIDNGMAQPTIETLYPENNGYAYRINRVIQAPRNSVSKTLQNYSDHFSEFYYFCAGFGESDLLTWAGISPDVSTTFGTSEQDRYIVFTSTYGTGSSKVTNACVDENVKMFNTYNYTLYAPNNTAMSIAYQNGLPSWSDVEALYNKYSHDSDDEEVSAEETADKNKAYAMINIMREFVRYHFQNESLYADNTVEGGQYSTMHSDELGVAEEITVSGGSGKINVTDGAGIVHVIDANDASRVSNKMARDYWFDRDRTSASSITTSSFCAVHEISEPFYFEKDASGSPKRYDTDLSSAKSINNAVQYYKELNANIKF